MIKGPTSSTFVFRREAGTWLTALIWHPRLECWLPSGGHVASSRQSRAAPSQRAPPEHAVRWFSRDDITEEPCISQDSRLQVLELLARMRRGRDPRPRCPEFAGRHVLPRSRAFALHPAGYPTVGRAGRQAPGQARPPRHDPGRRSPRLRPAGHFGNQVTAQMLDWADLVLAMDIAVLAELS